jgi:protein phosphatase PTC7
MGVADGVYMWKELGIDSGTMARTLMETSLHMVAAGCEDVFKGITTAGRLGCCQCCRPVLPPASSRLLSA